MDTSPPLDADVEWAVEDHLILPTRIPNDVLYGKQWALQRVGAEAAWDVSVGGPAAAARAVRLGGGHSGHAELNADPQLTGEGDLGKPLPRAPAANLSATARLGSVTVCIVDSGGPAISASDAVTRQGQY